MTGVPTLDPEFVAELRVAAPLVMATLSEPSAAERVAHAAAEKITAHLLTGGDLTDLPVTAPLLRRRATTSPCTCSRPRARRQETRMRVNVDSKVLGDPRFRRLGHTLGISWREALGIAVVLWLQAYENRSAYFGREDVDFVVERQGFAAIGHWAGTTPSVVAWSREARKSRRSLLNSW